uniref:Tyrosine decarboxylase 1-like n=1 Tax=Nelumbo nucifera TaxID=4432 RepID=A0A822ZJD0_NELNU|nr:TPA_asm: hypothetical protein HUJ06_016151 [Nelumbo nucifera]
MAKHFEDKVTMDKRFEIVVPRNFAMVCFQLLPPSVKDLEDETLRQSSELERANEINRKLLESINSTGRIYMIHAVVGGVYMIRFAVGASLAEDCHVNLAWKVVQEHAEAILKAC